MVKWEYKELWLSATAESDLDHLGVEGWELVSIIAGDWVLPRAYFKRPIKNATGPFIKREIIIGKKEKWESDIYTPYPSGEILPKENAHFNRLLEEKKRYKELLFEFRFMVLELLEADNMIPSEVRKKAYMLIDSCYDDNGELIA